MAVGLVLVRDRNVEGGPALEEGEELKRAQAGVSLVLGNNQQEQGGGTLYITSRRLVWLSSNDYSSSMQGGGGYAVDFRSLTMHAVSRDVEAFAKPCIYAQIESAAAEDVEDDDIDEDVDGGNGIDVDGDDDDTAAGPAGTQTGPSEAMMEDDGHGRGAGAGAGDGASASAGDYGNVVLVDGPASASAVAMDVDDDGGAGAGGRAAAAASVSASSAPSAVPLLLSPQDLSAIADMRLVPQDPDVLDELFQVLCECALLNPDFDDDDAASDGAGDFFFNEEEVLANAGALHHQNGHGVIQALEGDEEVVVGGVSDVERFEDAEHDDEC